jgi:hypothetical protein
LKRDIKRTQRQTEIHRETRHNEALKRKREAKVERREIRKNENRVNPSQQRKRRNNEKRMN